MLQAWYHICLQLLNFNYLFAIFQPSNAEAFCSLTSDNTEHMAHSRHGKKYRGFWAQGDALLTDLLGNSKHIHPLHGSAISSLKSAQLGMATIKLQPCPPSAAHSHPWVTPLLLQQKPLQRHAARSSRKELITFNTD